MGGSQPTWGRKTQSRERCFSSSSQIPSAVAGTLPGTAVAKALRHRREGGLASSHRGCWGCGYGKGCRGGDVLGDC